MLRATTKTLVGKYAQFLIENKGKYSGLTFAEYSKKMGGLYRSLSRTAVMDLKRRASKTKLKRNTTVRQPKRPSKYACFVRVNLCRVNGRTQQEKIRHIAALWRSLKRRTEETPHANEIAAVPTDRASISADVDCDILPSWPSSKAASDSRDTEEVLNANEVVNLPTDGVQQKKSTDEAQTSTSADVGDILPSSPSDAGFSDSTLTEERKNANLVDG